jgi:hypothetical protein
MRTKTYTLTGLDASANGIVTAQAISAGVPLTLQAAAADLDPPRKIVIDGSGTIAGSFVVVGTDRYGNVQTETISGVTTTEVQSKGVYASITSITPSDTDADTVTVGWPVGVYSPWILCGRGFGTDAVPEALVSVLTLTGTPDADIEVTYDEFPRLADTEITVDQSILAATFTPGTPQAVKGQGVRVHLTTGAATSATVKVTRPGPYA